MTQPLEEQPFEEELKALAYLKEQWPNHVHYIDEFLLSCLFSRKMDIARTIELLNENWEWRVEYGFENIPTPDDIDFSVFKCYNSVPGARTKDDHGLLYFVMDEYTPGEGAWTPENIIKWAAYYQLVGQYEKGVDISRNGLVMVQNLDGFGWKHVNMKMSSKLSAIFGEKFPMRIAGVWAVNAPSILKAVMFLMRPFTKKKMLDRFKNLGEIEELKKYIDEEQMLDSFGGKYHASNEDYIASMHAFVQSHINFPEGTVNQASKIGGEGREKWLRQHSSGIESEVKEKEEKKEREEKEPDGQKETGKGGRGSPSELTDEPGENAKKQRKKKKKL
eukprot:TRINITY_DN12207_c0_g1_i1.p1 TRINITY_DN12207_c0_g1~~TRINITY_DN12207_c0_g1_i1.p1  ORF type:complete len:388 (+),score=96.86 TRINITY_DN12207_c0_g1_i1:168-1166(+)